MTDNSATTSTYPASGKSRRLVITGARVLSMDPTLGDLASADIVMTDGVIEAVGNGVSPAGPVDERIEAAGRLVMPGLVDTHTHLWNGIWRSLVATSGPDTEYGALGVGMGPLFTPEDSYLAVYAGALEMLSCGVTTVHNWAHNVITGAHADAELQAALDAGIRSRFSYGYHWTMPRQKPMDCADVLRVRDQWTSDLTTVGLALRNDTSQSPDETIFPTLSVDPAILKEEMDFARSHDIPLTMHLLNPVAAPYWIDAGYARPDNLLVHGYHFGPEDWRLLAAADAGFSVSPYSALIGRRTLVPLGDMLDSGMTVGISCDHMAGAGRADLFRLMNILRVNESLRIGQPLPWRRAIELATIDGARLLGMDHLIGSVTPGKRADLVMLDTSAPTMRPLSDLAMVIANSASPAVIDTVIVDGDIVKRAGQLTSVDAADVGQATDALLASLLERMHS